MGSGWRTISRDGDIERPDETVTIQADGSITITDSSEDTDDPATFDWD